MNSDNPTPAVDSGEDAAPHAPPKPLTARQRRILGVLIEKARTTPDAYPLSLNGLVTGANQKSNRHPLMNLTPEQVEDELFKMRELGVVAEVHGGGRVPKYRHYGYDYLGIKGVEAAVMTELLLRGEQTAGELRSRASRFEPIADLATLDGILQNLIHRGLVVALTPPGRGQLFTHNLYLPEELQALRAQAKLAASSDAGDSPRSSPSSSGGRESADTQALRDELTQVRQELDTLRGQVQELQQRMQAWES